MQNDQKKLTFILLDRKVDESCPVPMPISKKHSGELGFYALIHGNCQVTQRFFASRYYAYLPFQKHTLSALALPAIDKWSEKTMVFDNYVDLKYAGAGRQAYFYWKGDGKR